VRFLLTNLATRRLGGFGFAKSYDYLFVWFDGVADIIDQE